MRATGNAFLALSLAGGAEAELKTQEVSGRDVSRREPRDLNSKVSVAVEASQLPADPWVKFLSRDPGSTLFLTGSAAGSRVYDGREGHGAPANSPEGRGFPCQSCEPRKGDVVSFKLHCSNSHAEVLGGNWEVL